MNQYIVLVLDALLHLGSICLLGFLISIVVKICSRGHVDFRLIGGMFIIFILTILKMFLESRIGGYLPELTPDILFGLLGVILLVVTSVLIYWQYSVSWLAAFVSGILVVALQFGATYGVPKLSLYWMPEGQRFAEYAGFASEQTAQLMEQAKNFKKREGEPSVWQKTLAALAFFTSHEEKENLSRNFSSGIEVYRERKALMDSMSDEELAEYRRAMAEFLEEQGLSENRYSLSNLKNVQPEDLANLGSFMQELNSEFELDAETDAESIPSSAESIRKISENLRNADLSDQDREILDKLLSLVDNEDFETGMEEARAELSELKKERPVGELLFSKKNKTYTSSPVPISEPDLVIEPDIVEVSIENEPASSDVDTKLKAEATRSVFRDTSDYIPYSIGIGVLSLPPEMHEQQLWVKAADAIPYRAWFVGQGAEAVTKLILEDIVLSPGDDWQFKYEGMAFVFHFDEVSPKGVHISAVQRL